MPETVAIPTVAEALLDHLQSCGAVAGQVDAVREMCTDPDAGFMLSAIVEGGIPEVTHPLEDQLRAAGGDPEKVYWRSYCAGYKVVVKLKMDFADTPMSKAEWEQEPTAWMQDRIDRSVQEARAARQETSGDA